MSVKVQVAPPVEMDSSERMIRLLCCGATSGIVTKTCIAPLERVKILFQIQGMHIDQKPKYTGIVQTLVTVVKEEGLSALYKGNGANVLRIVPTYGLKFAFNDFFKDIARGSKPKDSPLDLHQLMLSGSMAGLFQITCTYPLELIRTRLSLSEGMRLGTKYKGIIDCATQTVKVEGTMALYKGIWPTWLSGTPYVALQMTFYDLLKRNAEVNDGGDKAMNTLKQLASGATAGILAQTLTYPGDTLRRRMQTNGIGGTKLLYESTMDCFRKTVKNEGVQGLYKGCLANCIRAIPGAAIQFVAYDNMKLALGV